MIQRKILASALLVSLVGASASLAQTVTPTAPLAQPPTTWDKSTQQALEMGQPGIALPWQNPDGTAGGTIIASPPFQDASGQTCREFQQTLTLNGQPQQAFGMACRQPDGSWQLRPAPPAAAFGEPQPVVAYALPPAYYYPEPFYAPLFFGFGCCFRHFHHGGHFSHHH